MTFFCLFYCIFPWFLRSYINKPYRMTFRCKCWAGLDALGSHFLSYISLSIISFLYCSISRPNPYCITWIKLRRKKNECYNDSLPSFKKTEDQRGCRLLKWEPTEAREKNTLSGKALLGNGLFLIIINTL